MTTHDQADQAHGGAAVGGAAAGEEPDLIGVEDIRTPYWARIQEAVATAGVLQVVTAVLRVGSLILSRAWRASPRLTVAAVVLNLASGVAMAAGLFATAHVFTALLEQAPSLPRVLAAAPAIAVVTATYALRALMDAAIGTVQAALSPLVERLASDELYVAVLRVELASFDDPDFTELLGKASRDGLIQLKSATSEVLDLARSMVSVMAAIVATGLFHPLLLPTVVLIALPQGWAATRSAKISYKSFVRMTSRNRRLGVASELMTSRRSAAEVRAFTMQSTLLAEHRRLSRQVVDEARAADIHKARVRLAGRALAGVGTALGYLVLALLLSSGMLALALAGAAAIAIRTASSAVNSAVLTANRLYEASLYIEMYLSCLADAANRQLRPPRTPAVVGGKRSPRMPQCVEFSGVSFCYPGSDRSALTDVSIIFSSGQVVALVGANGSGKSTLAKLATGLYLPCAGVIRWDGIDIRDIDQDTLAEHCAIIMQNPLEWPMTAANNIRVGRIERYDPHLEDVRACAVRSGAHSMIQQLHAGYATVLSTRFQRGTDLSGGQWQRVGIARGLYRNADFVVADEPTAALDAHAEHEVFQTLRNTVLGEHRTQRLTLLITHRLANIRHADQIVVLSSGRITETGTHTELMRKNGEYAKMFSLQAAQYESEANRGR